MTLEKIRASLPTHIMLTPRVHRWRDGDEWYYPASEMWFKIKEDGFGSIVDNEHIARRPIPPHILDSQAFWLRFGDSAFIRVGTREEHEECAFLRPDKNGGGAFYLQSTVGRLYDKWLLEQMEDV